MKEKRWLPDPSTWKNTWRDDWRIAGQEGYLCNKHLQHRVFDRSVCVEDFDQCEFCWAIFDEHPDHPSTAYYDPSTRVWVCESCYRDFKKHFNWTSDNI